MECSASANVALAKWRVECSASEALAKWRAWNVVRSVEVHYLEETPRLQPQGFKLQMV